MQKVANTLMNRYLDKEKTAIRPPVQLGPKGHPIAAHHFQDALPKIIAEFGIKSPQDRRLWKVAKERFWWIESRVAYIKEQQEIDFRKTGKSKPLTEYSGLLLFLIFKKHQGN